MKRIVVFLMALFASLTLLACEKNEPEPAPRIAVPDKESIQKIQIESSRIDADMYPSSQMNDFLNLLGRALPVEEAPEIQRGEEYFPISLIYQDGTKDVFFFFQQDGKWYMETEEGTVYKNVDSIVYLHQPSEREEEEREPEIEVSPDMLKIRLKLEKDFETLGVESEFVFLVQFFMEELGETEKEAVAHAKEFLTENMKLYLYAKQEGLQVSEEELEEQMAYYETGISNAEANRALYEEAGITPRESVEKNKELIRFQIQKSRVYSTIRNQFADGADTVAGRVCETWQEYCEAYLEKDVYPNIKESELKDFNEQLEQAERLYEESYSETAG